MSRIMRHNVRMSFDVSDLPSPENRSAQQWVTYYLRLESVIAAGQTVRVGDQLIEHHQLDSIRKSRMEWEARAAEAVSAAAGQPKRAPVYVTF